MFRDRTNLYISYRRTYPHHNRLEHETASSSVDRFDRLREEEEGLIGDNMIEDDGIQLKTLPPSFIELSQEIEDVLKFINSKIDELNYLYKKNLLPGFNDNSIDMKKIDDLNFTITKNFQKSYNMIKKIDNLKNQPHVVLSQDELIMCENIKKKLALETQSMSKKFRKLQNNYIKFLKDDEDYETNFFNNNNYNYQSQQNHLSAVDLDDEPSTEIESYSRELLKQSQTVLLEEEQAPYSLQDQVMKQREEEISKIAMGVIEISTIFKELENMIIDQGTILDRIDYNLNNVTIDLRKLDKELISSQKTQKRTQKCKLILLLSLVVFALLIIVMMRPSRRTIVDHETIREGSGNSNSNDNKVSETTEPAAKSDTNAPLEGTIVDDEQTVPPIEDADVDTGLL